MIGYHIETVALHRVALGLSLRDSLHGPGKPQCMLNVHPHIVLPAGLLAAQRKQQPK